MIVAKFGQGDDAIWKRVPGTADVLPTPPEYTPASEVDRYQRESAEVEAEAGRARMRRALLVVVGGVTVAGAVALIVLTREPGSVRRRRGLRSGQIICKWGVRYRVGNRGNLARIGNC